MSDIESKTACDLHPNTAHWEEAQFIAYANFKLTALGYPIFKKATDMFLLEMMRPLFASHEEHFRLLHQYLCPADQRIQTFLDHYLSELPASKTPIRIPNKTFVLDRHGLARTLSLQPDSDRFSSDILTSYRVKNGILHNPRYDRRTTKGSFHVVEGGLPIPDDKKAVPKLTFARLLYRALHPPHALLELPFTASQDQKAECFVSLLLRPIVCPEAPGWIERKSMEIRFFAPGNLVCNLDFVESIFGNAGDPSLPENNAALDGSHWTGHTGCIILATHLTELSKKELGLPPLDKATERQKRDGMYWEDENERYNDGLPFKITARDHQGVMVTLIADNYFGYCKKEVKTQISYSSNLYGLCEEEHSGGALVFPSYDLGEDCNFSTDPKTVTHTFAEMTAAYHPFLNLSPEGYATDKRFPDIVYLPENSHIRLDTQEITWDNGSHGLKLLPHHIYVLPSGYKVRMLKPAEGRRWRLVGTNAEGVFCHKPCTVSGGGKSEISKSIVDAMADGSIYINDFTKDFDAIETLINKDYGGRFRDPQKGRPESRPLLSSQRSLGSVIKLLTPSNEYTAAYNAWIESIPQNLKDLTLLIKRYYKPDWGSDWRNRFSVDILNGTAGNELRYHKKKIITDYLRVGFTEDGSWRTFGLRKDFFPAAKLSQEDDITASVIVPKTAVRGLNPAVSQPSVKFVENCENRFFQRPDDAIIRGYDKHTEADMSRPKNFLSNYEPLTRQDCIPLVQDAIRFEQYTPPMQRLIRDFVAAYHPDYVVSSAHPRLVEGKPSKNPRYLQNRPDLENPRDAYLAEIGIRLYRKIPLSEPVAKTVDLILPGRRNNRPEPNIEPLCVFNPIHYLELPECFMEFIASLTGKSPSTTGAGSEGALTKGPFNALLPIHDLNNALTGYLLTGYSTFITAAGYIGPHFRVDHDISLLVPEIWCRMRPFEREPAYLIKEKFLEKCEDMTYNGRTLPSSRLGYRITDRFVAYFGGRIFNIPSVVFTETMLKPERQDLDVFAAGIDNIVNAHCRVAKRYFSDGSIEAACPPLKALLHIMAYGHYDDKTLDHPEIRSLFTRETTLNSQWYRDRIKAQQKHDQVLYRRHIKALETFLATPIYAKKAQQLTLSQRLKHLRQSEATLASPDYLQQLTGTIGIDPELQPKDKT